MRDTSRMGTPGREASLRVSDAERERTAGLLRGHFSAGRLSDDELSERVEAAYRARTRAELDALTDDLPSPAAAAGEPVRQRRRRSGFETSVRMHAIVFLLVNLMLIGIWAAAGGGYFWPIWSILGWGIGLGCHAAPLLAGGGRRSHSPSPPAIEQHRSHRHSHSASRRRRRSSSVDEMASSVAAERPSLRPAAAPDGTVTILFSDIEGSTALNEQLGDVRWLDLLREHHRIVREQVQACGGFEVKSQGDG